MQNIFVYRCIFISIVHSNSSSYEVPRLRHKSHKILQIINMLSTYQEIAAVLLLSDIITCLYVSFRIVTIVLISILVESLVDLLKQTISFSSSMHACIYHRGGSTHTRSTFYTKMAAAGERKRVALPSGLKSIARRIPDTMVRGMDGTITQRRVLFASGEEKRNE